MKECHERCTNHLLFTVTNSNKHRKLLLLQMRSYTLTGVNYQSLIWRDPCNKIKRRKPAPFNATSVILWHPATSAPPSYLRRAALVKGPSCLPQEMQHLAEVLWLLQLGTWLFNRIRILDDLGAESVTCESSSLACISGFKFSNLYIILKTYCRMFDPHYKSPAPAAVLFLASVVRWQLLGLDPPQASAAGRSGFQALNTWYHESPNRKVLLRSNWNFTIISKKQQVITCISMYIYICWMHALRLGTAISAGKQPLCAYGCRHHLLRLREATVKLSPIEEKSWL